MKLGVTQQQQMKRSGNNLKRYWHHPTRWENNSKLYQRTKEMRRNVHAYWNHIPRFGNFDFEDGKMGRWVHLWPWRPSLCLNGTLSFWPHRDICNRHVQPSCPRTIQQIAMPLSHSEKVRPREPNLHREGCTLWEYKCIAPWTITSILYNRELEPQVLERAGDVILHALHAMLRQCQRICRSKAGRNIFQARLHKHYLFASFIIYQCISKYENKWIHEAFFLQIHANSRCEDTWRFWFQPISYIITTGMSIASIKKKLAKKKKKHRVGTSTGHPRGKTRQVRKGRVQPVLKDALWGALQLWLSAALCETFFHSDPCGH